MCNGDWYWKDQQWVFTKCSNISIEAEVTGF